MKDIRGQYLLMREHVLELDRLKAALRSCILALERINLESTEIMDCTESRVPTADIERGNRSALKGRRAISPNAEISDRRDNATLKAPKTY